MKLFVKSSQSLREHSVLDKNCIASCFPFQKNVGRAKTTYHDLPLRKAKMQIKVKYSPIFLFKEFVKKGNVTNNCTALNRKHFSTKNHRSPSFTAIGSSHL